jgi:3-methyladenine DNA glycosylase AlkC
MQAATPLPLARVHVVNGRLAIDWLTIGDETAVRLAAEREDPTRFVVEAIEIGARVLDREQTGANAEFVRAEFEKTARELDAEFVERARKVAERLDAKVDEVFGPEHGHVTKALARHFGDESSVAVQNRVKALLSEVSVQMREDLRRQFTSDSESNPLHGFQNAHLAATRQIAGQQSEQMRAMNEKLEKMTLEIAQLRSEKEKLAEIAAVEDKGTAKGRTYEEAVAEVLDTLASARGDVLEAVGDTRGEGGKKGDFVVAIDACSGPARGKIVFEAKNRKLSKNEALAELDGAIETRTADYAVLVVSADDKLPARTHPLREFNGDKLFVAFDPEDGSTLALEVAYGLARARVLMARAAGGGIDEAALRVELERAQGAMDDVRRIKSQLTNATTGIDAARTILDAMAVNVRGHLTAIELLLAEASAAAADDG